jgi:hypothetical protein
MKLLVDADYIVYKSCAGAEDEIDWGDDVILVISKFSEALKILGKKFTQNTRVIEIEKSRVVTVV